MVRSIGALRTLPAAPVDRAVEYALALISGWAKKEREPFKAALEDLRESAKHNAEVYEQASAALKELSARGKEVRDLAAAARSVNDAAQALKRQTEAETTEAWALLAAEQAVHGDRVDSFNRAADAHDSALVERATVANTRDLKLTADEAALAQRVRETETLAQEAAAVRDRYNAAATAIAAIINRKD